MRCNVARRRVALAAGGDLPPGRQPALDRHLAGCASCRRELDELRLMIAQVRSAPAPVRPREADAAFQQRIVAAMTSPQAPAVPLVGALLASAAAVAAVVVAIAMLRPAPEPKTPVLPVAEQAAPWGVARHPEEHEPPTPPSPPAVEDLPPQRVAQTVEPRPAPAVEPGPGQATTAEVGQRVPIKIVTSDPSVVIYWNVPITGGTT